MHYAGAHSQGMYRSQHAGMCTRLHMLTCGQPCAQRAEHHSTSLHELEELSLAQQHLDHIDLLGCVCPNLKILTLQANSIAKLENLSRLKVGDAP